MYKQIIIAISALLVRFKIEHYALTFCFHCMSMKCEDKVLF